MTRARRVRVLVPGNAMASETDGVGRREKQVPSALCALAPLASRCLSLLIVETRGEAKER